MKQSTQRTATKKPVLVRIPQDLYDQLVVLSAVETISQGATMSVPALVVELIRKTLDNPKVT